GLQTDGWMVRSVIVWCLAPGTVSYAKTATTEGPMTLHDLVRLDPSTVQLWTGEKWSRVLGWSPSQAEGALRFTLRSGETISCTAGHQWPLADGRPAMAVRRRPAVAPRRATRFPAPSGNTRPVQTRVTCKAGLPNPSEPYESTVSAAWLRMLAMVA